jgi:hypothetical protein
MKLNISRLSITPLWCLILLTLAASARAQWTGEGGNLNVSDSNNWLNGDINFRFVYSGPEVTYDLGTMTFTSGAQNGVSVNPVSNIPDWNVLLGNRVIGAGLAPNTFIYQANSAASTISFGRQTAGAGSGNYTASNYGVDTVVPALFFEAGSTVLNTDTYDARQFTLGTIITGAGIAPGTYVTGVNNAGQITVSQAATGAAGGSYTVAGLSTYGKALNLTYSGDVTVPKDLVFINTNNSQQGITNSGSGKLIFADPDAKVIVTVGAGSDVAFALGGTLQFMGNATFSANYGLSAANGSAGNGRYSTANTNITLNAVTDVAGDFTLMGPDRFNLQGLATQNLTLHGGSVNLLDGATTLAYSGQNLIDARIRGAGEINIASASSKVLGYTYVFLNASQGNNQTAMVNLLESSTPVNLFSGGIVLQGDGDFTVVNRQTVGAVNLKSGLNFINFNNGTKNGFTLNMSSLNRENGATVNLGGLSTGFASTATNGKMLVQNDANILADLVGTSDVVGSTNLKILPWAAASPAYTTGAARERVDMVTYVSGSGFRALSADEYQVNSFTGTDNNVRLDAASTLTGDATINSLKNTVANGTHNINGTLTVNSGLLLNAVNAGVTYAGTGTISSGGNALIINGWNATTINNGVVLYNTVTGTNPGLIVANNLTINSAGNYGGMTLVEGAAILNITHQNAIPVASGLRLDMGTRLAVNSNNAIAASLAGTGTVSFGNTGMRLGLGGSEDGVNGFITVKAGAFIAPGDVSGPLQASEMFIGGFVLGVDFKAGSLFKIDLVDDLSSDLLAAFNTSLPQLIFEDDSIIELNLLNGYAPTADTSWLLGTGFNSVTLGNVLLQDTDGDNLSGLYSLSVRDNNLLLSYTIPEPSTWLLLGAGVMLLTLLRRRRPAAQG